MEIIRILGKFPKHPFLVPALINLMVISTVANGVFLGNEKSYLTVLS